MSCMEKATRTTRWCKAQNTLEVKSTQKAKSMLEASNTQEV
jgi:hypothetical protein